MAQETYNETIDKHTDWNGDASTGNLPVSGEKVQEFIKTALEGRFGYFHFDQGSNKYWVFADQENYDLYISDPTTYKDYKLSEFDAPAPYTIEVSNLTSSKTIRKGKTGNYVEFEFATLDKTGGSTHENVMVQYIISNGGVSHTINQTYAEGTHVQFLVDPYLNEGTNVVVITVTGVINGASTTVTLTYNVVDLQLTSTFNFATPVSSTNVSFPYTLQGAAGLKYVEFYLDGVLQGEPASHTQTSITTARTINLSSLGQGKHTIQARAYITDSSGIHVVDGDVLYYEIYITGQVADTAILLAFMLAEPYTDTLNPISLQATQYETLDYAVASYNSSGRRVTVNIEDVRKGKGHTEDVTELTTSVATDPSTTYDMEYTPMTEGTHVLTFSANDADPIEVNVTVSISDIGITIPQEDLVLELLARGRSNAEANPAVWTYGNITTSFSGFLWNLLSGWDGKGLVMPSGTSVNIGLAPLGRIDEKNANTTGRTIEIDFEVINTTSESAPIVSINDNGKLVLTATTAIIGSSANDNIVNTKFNTGDHVHLVFIVNPNNSGSIDEAKCYIVNNGILERADNYSGNFDSTSNLVIAPDGCSIRLFGVRVYSRALNVEEAFSIFALDSDDTLNIVSRNDIYNDKGLIEWDKVANRLPVMLITGDMSTVFNAQDKNATSIVDKVEYINRQQPDKDFVIENALFRPQGTSSLGYPRKNLRLYTNKNAQTRMYDYKNNLLRNGNYAFKDGAMAVNCWTLKADYAESSGTHNTGAARLWNDAMYNTRIGNDYVLRTEAQKDAARLGASYDIRTAIDGFPIVVFHRPNTEASWECLGQYNFDNDKSTEGVFGFTYKSSSYSNKDVQCFEFLNSSSALALFTDISDFDTLWSDAWESRYPDTSSPELAPLKTLATWINSCKDNQAKWDEEWKDHFDPYKLAAYYVYLMRFGGVDQTVKNSMIMTEDGVHWFFINYDNDTIIGIDNDSTVLNAWDYDRQTIQPGKNVPYYAGRDSVLWNCFEASDECMEYVITIDQALFEYGGLTYANMINMFDVQQAAQWCERIYNANGRYKYIEQQADERYLRFLQGARTSYRHWWLQHRMDKYDALWGTGAFRQRQIEAKVQQPTSPDTNLGKTFAITAFLDSYFGYGINNNPTAQYGHVAVAAGQTSQMAFDRNYNIGDVIRIYNSNNITRLDMSGLQNESASTLSSISFAYINGNDGANHLQALILGGTNVTNNFMPTLDIKELKALETLNVCGFNALTTIYNLNTINTLKTLDARNTSITRFEPATGATLTSIQLPSTIQELVLDAVSVNSMSFASMSNLRHVEITSYVGGNWSPETFVPAWISSLTNAAKQESTLVLTHIDWKTISVSNLCKLADIPNRTISGVVTYNSITTEEYNQLVTAFGTGVFDSDAVFRIYVKSNIVILGGATTLVEGVTEQYSILEVPATSGAWTFTLLRADETGTDEEGNYTRVGNAKMYENGRMVVTEDASVNAMTVTLYATKQGKAPLAQNISIQKRTYPSNLVITIPSGAKTMFTNANAGETVEYSYNFNTSSYNATPTLTASIQGLSNIPGSSIEVIPNSSYANKYSGVIRLTVGAITKEEYAFNAPIVLTAKFIGQNHADIVKTSDSFITAFFDKVILNNTDKNPTAFASIQTFARNNNITLSGEDYMTVTDARKFTTLRGCFQNNAGLIELEELKYFVNVTDFVSACQGCTNLTRVVMPEPSSTGRRMYDYMFQSCSYLTDVSFDGDMDNTYGVDYSETSSSIIRHSNSYMFRYCNALEKIELPAYFDYITYTFYGCNALKELIFHCPWRVYISYALSHNLRIKMTLYGGIYMYSGAWGYGCDELYLVNKHAYFRSILNSRPCVPSYSDYGYITKLYEYDPVTGIKTEITDIAETDISVGTAYASPLECTNIRSAVVSLPFNSSYSGTRLPDYWFYGCTNLKNVTIKVPSSTGTQITLGNYAFYNCSSLESVTFLNEDEQNKTFTNFYINSYCFWRCTSLRSLDISMFKMETLKILSYAFAACSALENLTIHNAVVYIDLGYNSTSNAFCFEATKIASFPFSKIRYTGGAVFYKVQTLLGAIELHDTSFYGAYFLGSNNGITKMTIKGNVTSNIERFCYYCENITELDLSGITSLALGQSYIRFASYCGSLRVLKLPECMKNLSSSYTIYSDALLSCQNVNEIYCYSPKAIKWNWPTTVSNQPAANGTMYVPTNAVGYDDPDDTTSFYYHIVNDLGWTISKSLPAAEIPTTE